MSHTRHEQVRARYRKVRGIKAENNRMLHIISFENLLQNSMLGEARTDSVY